MTRSSEAATLQKLEMAGVGPNPCHQCGGREAATLRGLLHQIDQATFFRELGLVLQVTNELAFM